MTNLHQQFLDLLSIDGISGEEYQVRNYLFPILSKLVDSIQIDKYGNLLGDLKCGDGNGATIMLSAHMDTVKGVKKDRPILVNRNIISTNGESALGADDRAGIAIILTVLRGIKKIDFNGHIKVAFCVEEEIGCVGSSKMDSDWYENVDLAIIADRRGNRDIVVGCGMAYCSNEVGNFLEDASKLIDEDWKCVEGGISDAMSFASYGINSVNLSCGYYGEHTNEEYADVNEMKDTVRFITQILAVVDAFYEGFGEVGSENNWVTAWYYDYKDSTSGIGYEGDFGYGTIASEKDHSGDVYVIESGADIIINQGDSEVILTRNAFKSLIDQCYQII